MSPFENSTPTYNENLVISISMIFPCVGPFNLSLCDVAGQGLQITPIVYVSPREVATLLTNYICLVIN